MTRVSIKPISILRIFSNFELLKIIHFENKIYKYTFVVKASHLVFLGINTESPYMPSAMQEIVSGFFFVTKYTLLYLN